MRAIRRSANRARRRDQGPGACVRGLSDVCGLKTTSIGRGQAAFGGLVPAASAAGAAGAVASGCSASHCTTNQQLVAHRLAARRQAHAQAPTLVLGPVVGLFEPRLVGLASALAGERLPLVLQLGVPLLAHLGVVGGRGEHRHKRFSARVSAAGRLAGSEVAVCRVTPQRPPSPRADHSTTCTSPAPPAPGRHRPAPPL